MFFFCLWWVIKDSEYYFQNIVNNSVSFEFISFIEDILCVSSLVVMLNYYQAECFVWKNHSHIYIWFVDKLILLYMDSENESGYYAPNNVTSR